MPRKSRDCITVNQAYSVNYSYVVHNSTELSTQGIKLRRYVNVRSRFHVGLAYSLYPAAGGRFELSTTFTSGLADKVMARILFEIRLVIEL